MLNREPPHALDPASRAWAELALAQLKLVLDAYSDRDAEAAEAVWRHDGEIDEMYNSLFRELLTYMMEDPRTIGLCTHLLFVAKNIERTGDHATNIAEAVLPHGDAAASSGSTGPRPTPPAPPSSHVIAKAEQSR